MKNCAINVNLGAAGVPGATYFLFCHIYARAEVYNVDNIIIVDSLNNLVGEYLLKCCNSSGIHIPLRFKYGKDYQIIYFKIIYVNSDGMVRMFRILIIIEEWHINILESIVLQDFFYAIRPILIFFRTVVP